MKQKLLALMLLLFTSINMLGFKWHNYEVKLLREMTDQEIIDVFPKSQVEFCISIKKPEATYTYTFDGYIFSGGNVKAGNYSLSDKQPLHNKWTSIPTGRFYIGSLYVNPIIGGQNPPDTVIIDTIGVERAHKVLYKEWKKQFAKSFTGVVQGVYNLEGNLVIKDKITVSSSDIVSFGYTLETYYKLQEHPNTSILNLGEYARDCGEESINQIISVMSGTFNVDLDFSNRWDWYSGNRNDLLSISFPYSMVDKFPKLENYQNLEKVYVSNLSKELPYLKGCTSLKNVSTLYNTNWPEKLEMIMPNHFEGCTSLGSVSIPGSVEEIGDYAFKGCTSMSKVKIGNGVNKIGKEAFRNCLGLTDIELGKKLEEIGGYAFYGCTSLKEVSIPGCVKEIGDYAFAGCTGLTKVNINMGVEKIGENAFIGCSDLTNLTIESGEIGYSAFGSCEKLDNLSLGEGVSVIGSFSFEYCSSLKEVTIPNSVTSIGDHAFAHCTSLESAKLSNSVTTIEYFTFGSCTSLATIEIPNNVTSIGDYAFEGCRNLMTMNPHENEKRHNLDFINLPTSVKEIGEFAFIGCSKMKYLSLPNSLTSIGRSAFRRCENLLAVVSKIQVPFAIPSGVFQCEDGIVHAYLWVPIGTVSDYKNCDGWKEFGLSIGPYGDADLPLPGKPGSPDDVTITANSYTIAYGDDLPEFEYTTTWAALSGTPEITCNATKTSPVGTYPIVVSKGSVTYNKTSFVNGTLTITKAPLTIKAGNYTKMEGEENPAFTLTYEGFKNNETAIVLTKLPTVSCSATKGSPAGSYTVNVSGAEARNYEINCVAGTLTVTAKDGGSGGDNPDAIITIADSKAMDICVERWDTDGDGKLSKAEAAAVTDIGDMFKGNQELTSLDMLQFFTGLTTIPKSAFSGCTSLKSIRLPKTIKSIENYAFCYCYELTSLTIPASVTSIGAYEFEYCHSLSEIIVEEGNTVYDSRNHCNAIIETKYNNLKFGCKNTVIPESVTQTGGSDVFYGNEGLTSIHIPANINYINSGLFSGCKNLSSITVASDNGKYDSRNNCNAIIETGTNDLIEGCKSTVIPNDVVSIHYYAFSERAAGKVTIPGNVKTIGDQAFNSCKELKTVVMEEGVEEIGDNTFQSCRALETIVLPSTITTIKSRAFANDNNVKFVISNISAPSEIPTDAFSACYSGATLYVLAGTKSLYMQTPGWQGFANIVEMGQVERGNANGDNAVNQTDVELVKDYIMEGKTEGLNFINADANGDYEINAADIVKILNIIK